MLATGGTEFNSVLRVAADVDGHATGGTEFNSVLRVAAEVEQGAGHGR